MTVKFELDNSRVPNGTVLLFGISYAGMGQTDLDTTRGRETPKVFTYTMLKAGGTWYVSGGGSTPQGAGWGAVTKWLARDNRVVEWVKVVTETADLWPTPEPAKLAEVDTSQSDL